MPYANEKLLPGLTGKTRFKVREEHLATQEGSGNVRVLATPKLVAAVEQAALNALSGALPDGLTTVGTHIDLYHKAATPPDMEVECAAVLAEISANGKGLIFDVSAFDEAGEVARGKHERVIVDLSRFESSARARKKT